MALFRRDPIRRLVKYSKQLNELKQQFPNNWFWHKDKIPPLVEITKKVETALEQLHKQHEGRPDIFVELQDMLRQFQAHLKNMEKASRPSAEEQNRAANRVQYFIGRIIVLLIHQTQYLRHEEAELALLEEHDIPSSSSDIHKHPLYADTDERFSQPGILGTLGQTPRREFEKTGGRTVLVGGKFIGKVVMKVVSERAYLSWKKAFEAKDFWRKEDFDYIPVEPMLSEGKRLSSGKYIIRAKVLGPSLRYFLANRKNRRTYGKQLRRDRYRIWNGLVKLDIVHGHEHTHNFCIAMHEGKPRWYIIDFDLAVSP